MVSPETIGLCSNEKKVDEYRFYTGNYYPIHTIMIRNIKSGKWKPHIIALTYRQHLFGKFFRNLQTILWEGILPQVKL